MDNLNEQRNAIDKFRTAVDQASFILENNPELTFPQIYNRIQWEAEQNALLKNKLEEQQKNYKRPWLNLLTRPGESSF